MFIKALVLTILVSQAITLPLIVDPQNPVQLIWPTTSDNQTNLDLKFKFQPGSNTLVFGQVFGVVFPSDISTLKLNEGASPKWGCQLTNDDNGKPVSLTAIQGPEVNIAYCRLDDLTNSPLSVGVNYRLTILLNFVISANLWSNIGVFTATSSDVNRLYIDSQPVFGVVGQYGNWASNSILKPLAVKSVTFVNKSVTGNVIYPWNTFDLVITLTTNAFIRMQDMNLTLFYPDKLVTPTTTSVTSDKTDNVNPLLAALQGTLSLSKFTANGFVINGIQEDLVPGREFSLTLPGWTAKPDVLETADYFEVALMYVNTYSVYSYNTIDITIKKSSLSVSATHPDGWDLWRNAAWPVKFTVRSPIDLNGGFLKLQHTNAKDGLNRWSFIASTCDLSANTVDQGIGKRAPCYPLRTDFNYPNRTGTYAGSGVFVKVGKIAKDTDFILTVWGFADNCGGDDNTNYGTYDLINKLSSSSANFEFTASYYSSIDATKLAEDRLVNQVTSSSSTPMAGKCYNNRIQGSQPGSLAWRFDDTLLGKITLSNANVNDANNSSMDIALFREVYDWGITSQTSSTGCSNGLSDCYALDINKNTFNEKFLYSGSYLETGSYFLIRAKLAKQENDPFYKTFAFPYTAKETSKVYKHRMVFLFSKNWFTAGEETSKCYLSWGLSIDNLDDQHKLLYNNPQSITTRDFETNFISTSTTAASTTLDTAATVTTGSVSTYKIVSAVNNGVKDATQLFSIWQAFSNSVNPTNEVTLALFTSCLKWTSTMPVVKSLYTYIDIQWQFHFVKPDASYTVNRNNRFIKLYPEGGVFNDYSAVSSTPITTSPIAIHLVWTTTEKAVCLIEIDGNTINQTKDNDSNILALWIYHGIILETDYNDASATYPTAPVSIYTSYGLQTGMPQSVENNYYANTNTYTYNLFSSIVADVQDINKTFNRTHHHFLMGSVLLVNRTSTPVTATSTSPAPNLLIPIYCPTVDNNNVFTTNKLPAVMGVWMKMTSHVDIGKVNRYLAYKQGTAIILTHTAKETKEITGTVSKVALKFNQYTNKSADDNSLFIFNSTKNNVGNDANCTSHILFLNKSVATYEINKVAFNGITPNTNVVFDSASIFYVFGKKFNSAIYTIVPNVATLSATSYSQATSDYFYLGITRPTIEDSPKYSQDQFAYFCSSKRYGENTLLTNRVNGFLLDYNVSTATWPKVDISTDKAEDNFKGDNAASLKFVINPPTSVPANSYLSFSLGKSKFLDQSICGLQIAERASPCSFTSLNGVTYVSCVNNVPISSFNVCCYNLAIEESVTITNLDVTFPTDNNSTVLNYLDPEVYDAGKQIGAVAGNPFTLDTKQGTAVDPLTLSAKVTSIAYSEPVQRGNIGKITFTVTLPRDPVRNMKLQILGNMQELLISSMPPRCFAQFGNDGTNADTAGNYLIDNCDVSGLTGTVTPLTITTKNVIYKCGLSFSRTLNISLWPVNYINFDDAGYNSRTFVVKMQTNLGNKNQPGYDLTKNDVAFSMPKYQFTKSDVLATQWNTLCPVSSISPKVSGEMAEYVFNFDLLTYKDKFKAFPNRLQIIFPVTLYNPLQSSIECYFFDVRANCVVTSEDIITINFNQDLQLGGTATIRIVGIKNPIKTDAMNFLCLVQRQDWSNQNDITTLLSGSGLNNAGVLGVKSGAAKGNLLLLNPVQKVSSSLPRATSTHQFFVALDNGVDISTRPINLTNGPKIIITFPSEGNYNLSLYNIIQSTVAVKQYVSDSATKTISASLLNVNGVSRIGNKLTVLLTDNLVIDANWRYLEIFINNIVNPMNDSADWNNSTGPFRVMITNNDESIVLRNYDNTVIDIAKIKQGIKLDTDAAYLSYFKGITFNWDNNKYAVDINNNTNNVLNMRIGRYTRFDLIMRTNIDTNVNIGNVAAKISLKDNIFKTLDPDYTISSSFRENQSIWIGVPCATAPGNYFLSFTLTSDQADQFYPLPIMSVMLDNTKGTISFNQIGPVAQGGSSAIIWYDLSETNFEPLSINWTKDVNNDLTATLSNATIKDGTMPRRTDRANNIGKDGTSFSLFSITNANLLTNQVFTTVDPNYCFTWVSNKLTIQISTTPANIIPGIDLASSFTYFTNTQNATIKKNSIGFTFTPPYAPVFLYCALTCTSLVVPSNTDLKTNYPASTPLISYYKAYFDSTAPYDIIFDNIKRNQAYRLTCLMESSLPTNSSSTRFTMETYTLNDTIGPVHVEPVPTLPSYCVEYTFAQEIQNYDAVLNNVINKCQKTVTVTNGWQSKGCTVCTDSTFTVTAPGLKLFNDSCDAPKQRRFRYLTDTTTTSTSAATSSSDTTTTTNTNTVVSTNAPGTSTTATQAVNKKLLRYCVTYNPTCSTDRDETFSQLQANYRKMADDFNTNFNTIAGSGNAAEIKTTIVWDDYTKPDLTKVKIDALTWVINGQISWTSSYDTPLNCGWLFRIQSRLQAPSFDEIWTCTTGNCGKTKTDVRGVSVSTDSNNLYPLSLGSKYEIFYACYNDILFARTKSDVTQVYTFQVPFTPARNDTSTSAGFIRFEILLLALIAIFLV
jgi:hypothetical protein